MYPDRQTAQLLIECFRDGFHLPLLEGLGYNLVNNLKSAICLPHIVQDKITKEILEG